jgi:hypothetical protein
MAELGEMRFYCPACEEPLTIPVKTRGGSKFTIGLVINVGVIRKHLCAAHPELAELAGEAVPGEQPAESGELRDRRR